MFSKFTVGEWVTLVDHICKGFVGYVSKYDYEDNTYYIELTTSPKGNRKKGHFWVEEHQLLKDEPVLDESEIKLLMDLALDTKDEAWFNELTQQLKMVV